MFQHLSTRLTEAFDTLRGQHQFTEANTEKALRNVRTSLLEADVALPVIKDLLETIKSRILGEKISNGFKPDQALIKIIQEELILLMGEAHTPINLKTTPPAIILLAGLQGSGKTTSAAKLARYLQEQEKKKVMLVSADVYRPAAIEQLERLAAEVDASFCPSTTSEKPIDIVTRAVAQAKKQFMDVLIVDTAGRLHVDDMMMQEIKTLHAAIQPIETLFVVDSMTGQDAANTAKAFHDTLPLTGIILTKTDGDARGGAALSIRAITGQPIKLIGSGEKTDALECFHPERMASRILGMGDILSLIEEVERKVDQKEQAKLKTKFKKGQSFNLNDFKAQLLQMHNMGGLSSMLTKLPGLGHLTQQIPTDVTEKKMTQTIAIINSMTPKERRLPKIILGSRKRRIAQGAGVQIQDVNRLLSQFEQMQKMFMKVSKGGGMKQLMRGLQGLPPQFRK